MSWNDEVDRAFARRREELLQEIVHDSVRVADDLGAVASACASKYPLAYLGTGVAAGACVAVTAGRPKAPARPRQRSRLMRVFLGALRFVPFTALLRG